MRQLVDNRLLAAISDAFPSRCTITIQLYTENAAKQQVPDGESNVTGLVNIPCRIGPLIEIRPTDSENRRADISAITTARQCKLLGFFSIIQPNVHRAVVDDVSYPIVGVEYDGNRLTTRLRLEVIIP